MSSLPPLSDRKERILKAIILEYIQSAEPIASDVVVKGYDLGVKAATVRSEMADITDQGLLDQPHTSAGRIPSDSGYRYYVDRLLEPPLLDRREKKAIQTKVDEEDTLQSLLEGVVRILARTTHLASAAATLRDAEVLVHKAVVTALGPGNALLVLMLRNGAIENRVVACPPELTLEELGRLNDILELTVEGRSLASLVRYRGPAEPNPRIAALLESAGAELRSTAKDLTRGRLIVDGEEYVVTQPEFQRNPGLGQAVLQALEDEEALREAIVDGLPVPAVIGRENSREPFQALTIIRSSFHIGGEEAGAVAVIGPTRLNYARGFRLVSFVAESVSQSLGRVFGHGPG
jgi:heat-inducible transcriptional repressor